MSQIYVVSHTFRSGGTAVAAVLHNCGVPFFPSIQKAINGNAPDEWNPGGHYADADFHALMVRLQIYGMRRPSETWVPDASVRAEIAALVQERSVAPKWGIKGAHSWVAARVLFGLGYNVRVIGTSRPLSQSQASYTDRIGEAYKEEAAAFVADSKAMTDAFYASFAGPKMLVDFDSLFDATRETVESIAAFAGVDVTPAAIASVNPNYRRYA